MLGRYLLGLAGENKRPCICRHFSSGWTPCFEADPGLALFSDDAVTKDSDGEGAGAVDQDRVDSPPDPVSVSEHDPCTSGK